MVEMMNRESGERLSTTEAIAVVKDLIKSIESSSNSNIVTGKHSEQSREASII